MLAHAVQVHPPHVPAPARLTRTHRGQRQYITHYNIALIVGTSTSRITTAANRVDKMVPTIAITIRDVFRAPKKSTKGAGLKTRLESRVCKN